MPTVSPAVIGREVGYTIDWSLVHHSGKGYTFCAHVGSLIVNYNLLSITFVICGHQETFLLLKRQLRLIGTVGGSF